MERARGDGLREARLRRLRLRIRMANRLAAKEIRRNVRKFGIIAAAAERDLRRFRGTGTLALRAVRNELKRSWQDLRRVAQHH